MNIVIAADTVPTKTNVDAFIKGNVQELFGQSIVEIFKDSDYSIVNLETPLSDVFSPISKCGPALCAPVDSINAYKKLGVKCACLANNHIMDQGITGLRNTIDTLKKSEIEFCGAGENLKEASKPFYFSVNGKKVGLYCCAEHEFSIASSHFGGANPFDPYESFDHVSFLKKNSDYVIVLYHGGKEYYRYPSPLLQKTCRKFIEKGADLVVCQHSHCIGSKEKYNHGTIVYGQGNFLFDHGDNEFRNSGLLIKISDNFEVSVIPIEKKGSGVQLATQDCSKNVLNGFETRSKEIEDPEFVETKYGEFAYKMKGAYQKRILGRAYSFLPLRLLNKIFGNFYLKYIYSESQNNSLLNCIECEAHRELLTRILKQEKKND